MAFDGTVDRRKFLLHKMRQINANQRDPQFHPPTCGRCNPPERDEFPLVPMIQFDANGQMRVVLVCPLGCGYVQA